MSRWFRSYGFAEVDDRLAVGAYPLDAADVGMLSSHAVRDGLEIDDALAAVNRRKTTADPLPHQVHDLHAWWGARG